MVEHLLAKENVESSNLFIRFENLIVSFLSIRDVLINVKLIVNKRAQEIGS